MAGTGHEYEVINLDRVEESLRSHVARIPFPEGKAWFASPRLLKYVTAPTFVARISGLAAGEAIARHVADAHERGILLRKVSKDCDLRMFVPEFLERMGPDLGHVADWIAALPKDDPRMVPKLRKVDVPAAVLLADRWVSRMARKAALAGKGEIAPVCDAGSGRIWVELKDQEALSAEGWRMNHCVYGYGDDLAAGTRIFSLRLADDRPVVTIELVPELGGMAVRQVKGCGNKAPLPCYFRDVVTFLNHMGVGNQVGSDVAGLGILMDSSAQWRLIHEVAKRIDIGGMAGFTNGTETHLVSPVDPERMVGVVTSLPEWQPLSGNRKQVLLVGAGDARFHTVAEQRAISRLANEVGVETAKNLPYLVKDAEGWWAPWIDTCHEWNVGPAKFLTQYDDTVYVMNESMRDILVTVGPGTYPGSSNLVAKVVAGRREWSVGEVCNLASVLDILRVESLEDGERSLARTGLHSGPQGRWFRFKDAAVEHPCAYASPDGRRLWWLVAPYRIALCDERGELVAADRDEQGHVHYLQGAGSNGRDHMEETCRLLNGLGIVAAAGYATRYSCIRWMEAAGADSYAVVCLGGVWKVVTSWRGLLKELRKVGRARYRDAICGETAIRLLPAPGTHPDADREMARYLAGWAARASKFELRLHEYSWNRNRPLEEAEGRLRAVAGMMGHLSPVERKAVARAAETMMRNVMGSSRSPKGIRSISRQEKMRDLLLLFRNDLGPKFLGRAVSWTMWALSTLFDGGEDGARIDSRWFDVFDRVNGNRRARSAIREAAMSTYWRLKHSPEEVRIDVLQNVIDWIRCLEMASFWYRSELAAAFGILDGMVASRREGGDWREARGLIAEAVGRCVEQPKAA